MGTFKVGDVVEWCGSQKECYADKGYYTVDRALRDGGDFAYRIVRNADELIVWARECDVRYPEVKAEPEKVEEVTKKLTGLSNDYYKVKVEYPTTPDNTPYLAECNDIIEALKMAYAEANVFKAIWRSAAARLGNGKVDHKAIYDAEKMVFFSQRVLMAAKTESKGV